MKLKLVLIVMAFSASTGYGTTVQITTGGSNALQDLTDSTGASLADAGFAAFGVWSGVDITDQATFQSEFTLGNFDNGSGLADTTTVITDFTGFGQDAVGFATEQFVQSSTTAYTGQNIVVAFWKGSIDRSTATELVVYQFAAVYPNGSTPLSIDYLNDPAGPGGAGGLIFGTSYVQTAILVPEPSSIALLALGSVALLLRRSR